MPVEQLVQHVCNMKQSYTQHGGTKRKRKRLRDVNIYTIFILCLYTLFHLSQV